jgi:hypothetical protein
VKPGTAREDRGAIEPRTPYGVPEMAHLLDARARRRAPPSPRATALGAVALMLASCGSERGAPATGHEPVPPQPTVRVEGELVDPAASVDVPRGAHAVGMTLVNDGDEPVSVRRYVEVLHYVGHGYESYEALEGLWIRDGCAPIDPDSCVVIPPRSRLAVPPWLGVRRGVGQCSVCDPSVPASWDARVGCDLAPGGAHAFRITPCEGPRLADGPRFVLPEPAAAPSAALCVAAAEGDLEAVRRLAGDDAERRCALPSSFEPEGTARSSALMLAAKYGHLDVVRHLLSVGFDPLARDPETQRSAYVHAAAGNHIAIVDLLWREGARPPADDPHLGTVLWSAATHDRRDILEHYAAQGADLDLAHFGVTPLEAAERASHAELARWLAARRAPAPEGARRE